jgi:branched-chain amino acid transport system substrate-binding protein
MAIPARVFQVAILLMGLAAFPAGAATQEQTIKVGVMAALTGVRADAGAYTMNALRMAEADLAAKPSTFRLRLIVEDTQYSPRVAVSAVQKLLDRDGVSFIIGSLNSSEVLAIAPVVEQARVLFVTPSAQSEKITNAGDYIFRLIHNTAQDTPAFTRYIASQLGNAKLDFLMMQTDAARASVLEAKAVLAVLHKGIGNVEEFDPDATDFRAVLLRLKAHGCTHLYVGAAPKLTALIVNQAADLRFKPQFYGYAIEGPDLLTIGGKNAEGLLYPYSLDQQSTLPTVRSFVTRYRQRWGIEPDVIAANSYDALMLLHSCVEGFGAEVEKVKQCFYATKNYAGAGGVFSINEKGDAVRQLYLKTVRNGAFVTVGVLEK